MDALYYLPHRMEPFACGLPNHNRILGVFYRVFETGNEPGRDIVCRLSISSDGRRLVVGCNKLNGRPKIFLWNVDYSQR